MTALATDPAELAEMKARADRLELADMKSRADRLMPPTTVPRGTPAVTPPVDPDIAIRAERAANAATYAASMRQPYRPGQAVDLNPAMPRLPGQPNMMPQAPQPLVQVDLHQPIPGLAVGQPFNVAEAVKAQPGLPPWNNTSIGAGKTPLNAPPTGTPDERDEARHQYNWDIFAATALNAAHAVTQAPAKAANAILGAAGLPQGPVEEGDWRAHAKLKYLRAIRLPAADSLSEEDPQDAAKIDALMEQHAPAVKALGDVFDTLGFIVAARAVPTGSAAANVPLWAKAISSAANFAIVSFMDAWGGGKTFDEAMSGAAHSAGLGAVVGAVPGGAGLEAAAKKAVLEIGGASAYTFGTTLYQTGDPKVAGQAAFDTGVAFLAFNLVHMAPGVAKEAWKNIKPEVKVPLLDKLGLPAEATSEQVQAALNATPGGVQGPVVGPGGPMTSRTVGPQEGFQGPPVTAESHAAEAVKLRQAGEYAAAAQAEKAAAEAVKRPEKRAESAQAAESGATSPSERGAGVALNAQGGATAPEPPATVSREGRIGGQTALPGKVAANEAEQLARQYDDVPDGGGRGQKGDIFDKWRDAAAKEAAAYNPGPEWSKADVERDTWSSYVTWELKSDSDVKVKVRFSGHNERGHGYGFSDASVELMDSGEKAANETRSLIDSLPDLFKSKVAQTPPEAPGGPRKAEVPPEARTAAPAKIEAPEQAKAAEKAAQGTQSSPSSPPGPELKAEAKQPWEMTAEAYIDATETTAKTNKYHQNRVALGDGTALEQQPNGNWLLLKSNRTRDDKPIRDFGRGVKARRAALTYAGNILHEDMVKAAVASGQPVPAAVLADYAGEPWADAAIAKVEKATPAAQEVQGQGREEGKVEPAALVPAEPAKAEGPRRVISEDRYQKAKAKFNEKRLTMGLDLDKRAAAVEIGLYHAENVIRKVGKLTRQAWTEAMREELPELKEPEMRQLWGEITKNNKTQLEEIGREFRREAAGDVSLGDLKVSGISNAAVRAERARLGMDEPTHGEKVTHDALNREASRIESADPTAADRLATELESNPRAPTALEDVQLIRRAVQYRNDRNNLESQLKAAVEARDEIKVGTLDAQITTARQGYSRFSNLVTTVGTKSGQSLALRAAMMKEDYSWANIELRLWNSLGREPTPEEIAKAQSTVDKLTQTEAMLEDMTKQRDAEAEKARLAEAHAELTAKQPPAERPKAKTGGWRNATTRNRIFTDARWETSKKELMEALSGVHEAVTATPALLAKLVKTATIGAGRYMEAGGRNLSEWAGEMLKEFGENVRPVLKEAWKAAKAELSPVERQATLDRAARRKNEAGDAGNLSILARKLYTMHFNEGITEPETILAAVHEDLKSIVPEMSRRESNDAVSRYGQWKELSREGAAVSLRQTSQLLQKTSAIEDTLSKIPPLKTGMEHEAPTDEVRRATAELRRLMKEQGIVATDPERQLKTALDNKKTALRNQNADLEEAIATRTKMVKGKSVSLTDAEVEELEARRVELRTQYDELFPKEKTAPTQEQLEARALSVAKRSAQYWDETLADAKAGKFRDGTKRPPLTTPKLLAIRAERDAAKAEVEEIEGLADIPERRALQATKTRLRRVIADRAAKLAAGDFSPPARPEARPLDREAFALRAEAQTLKNEIDRQMMRNRAANRNWFEKTLGWFGSWRVGAVLSSPTVFAKLTSAAATTMTVTPAEELIGAGLSRILPKGFTDKLAVERASTLRIEAHSFAQGFGRAMSDAATMLRTGNMDFGNLYGKPKFNMDENFMKYFGRMHGAFKTIPARAEFTRSLAKLTEKALANGVDITDPEWQRSAGTVATEEANRAIFRQRNWLTNLWRRVQMPNINPETGEETAGSTILRTASKVALPITNVPTNIIGATLNHIFGSLTGPARLAYRGGAFNRLLSEGMKQSFDRMTPDQADVIMRAMKKGVVGLAAMTIGAVFVDQMGGMYQKGKKREIGSPEYGGLRIFGVNVPRILLHHPFFICMQVGAAFADAYRTKAKKTDTETQGAGVAAAKAIGGLLEDVPFIRESLDLGRMREQPGEWASTFGRDILVPQLGQWAARQLDKPEGLLGPPTPRKAEGLKEHIQEVIPGWRNQLPVNYEKMIRELEDSMTVQRARGGRPSAEDWDRLRQLKRKLAAINSAKTRQAAKK